MELLPNTYTYETIAQHLPVSSSHGFTSRIMFDFAINAGSKNDRFVVSNVTEIVTRLLS